MLESAHEDLGHLVAVLLQGEQSLPDRIEIGELAHLTPVPPAFSFLTPSKQDRQTKTTLASNEWSRKLCVLRLLKTFEGQQCISALVLMVFVCQGESTVFGLFLVVLRKPW